MQAPAQGRVLAQVLAPVLAAPERVEALALVRVRALVPELVPARAQALAAAQVLAVQEQALALAQVLAEVLG